MSEDLLQIGEYENHLQFRERLEKALEKDPNNRSLQEQYADNLIDSVIDGVYKYDEKIKKKIRENESFKRFEKVVKNMSSASPIYYAIMNIINGKNASVIKDIENWFNRDTATLLNNNDFVYTLLIPLKNGFSGMWTSIKEIMKSYDVQEGLPEMCEALEVLYYSGDNEQIIYILSKVIRKSKEIYVAHELLGYTYYQMKMWKNAIACFESIIGNEEVYLYFPPITVYWWLAWAYNKTKNFIEEEACCRKVFSIFPDERYVLNNLGYCLYKQKRFDAAIEIFNDLITQKRDLPYAANNKVRTLLAMGQYEKAVSFINSYDGKITKELIKKAHSLREQKGAISSVKEIANIDNELDIEDDGTEEVSKSIELVDLGIKQEQFTNEKLLEDEIVARLERNAGAFGLPLTIYEKKGEYGRQYIIKDGRIDILAVDLEENYYVIELKKDKGYGDVYTQIINYINWIEENKAKKNQKVYGIICLNNPSEQLKEKVKANSKIRLFEYTISYTEVK